MFTDPGIESPRKFLTHVVLPVTDRAFSDELDTGLIVDLCRVLHQGFHVNGRILLHPVKLQMIAKLLNVLIRKVATNVHELGSLADYGREIALHVLVLQEQDVRLIATLPKRQHMGPHRPYGGVVGQEDFTEVLEAALGLVDQLAIVVVGDAQVLRIPGYVDHLGPHLVHLIRKKLPGQMTLDKPRTGHVVDASYGVDLLVFPVE